MQLRQLVAAVQFTHGDEHSWHALENSLPKYREGHEDKQAWSRRKYPLTQVRHRDDELTQVRQLFVQPIQVLDVVLRKVCEGHLEIHCF